MWELFLIAGLAIAGTGVWLALRKRPGDSPSRDSDTGVPYHYAGDGYTGANGHCADTTPADTTPAHCADADGGSDSCGGDGADGGGSD